MMTTTTMRINFQLNSIRFREREREREREENGKTTIVHFKIILMHKLKSLRKAVVGQLVEQLLPMPEVRGSNPVIG